jgi:hypothetical protein
MIEFAIDEDAAATEDAVRTSIVGRHTNGARGSGVRGPVAKQVVDQDDAI